MKFSKLKFNANLVATVFLTSLSGVNLSGQLHAAEFDYDGDGKADVAVRRPDTQYWYIKNSSGTEYNSERGDDIQRIRFGLQDTDIPVLADYDGDGKADFAVRRARSRGQRSRGQRS